MLNQIDQLEKERTAVKHIRTIYNGNERPGVSIIVPTIKGKYIENIFENYNRIEYDLKEMIIILNSDVLDINMYYKISQNTENIKIFRLSDAHTLGACLNFGVEKSRFQYIAKIDDDDYYGKNYLLDLMNAFKYSKAGVVGKLGSFIYFEENGEVYMKQPNISNQYVEYLNGSNLVIKKEVFNKVKFRDITSGEDTNFLADCTRNHIKIYSADKFNYICMRHEDLTEHTWKLNSRYLMSISERLKSVQDILKLINV